MRSRQNLFPAEPKIDAFLTDLAVHGHVAAATQNQAMHALVFLDTRVLTHALQGRITAVRADKQITVPVVMTREAVAAVLSRMDGTAHVVATLLYGSGLRMMEAVRLRVKDTVSGQPRPAAQEPLGREQCHQQQKPAQGMAQMQRALVDDLILLVALEDLAQEAGEIGIDL
jgi:hypothetical protein